MNIIIVSALFLAVTALFMIAFVTWKKSKITTGIQVQCSSGDSEVMLLNYNFYEGEDPESKAAKLQEAFDTIQARRNENHKKWLEMKAGAIQENEAKDPQELKLRSVTE